jgi:MFS family permease
MTNVQNAEVHSHKRTGWIIAYLTVAMTFAAIFAGAKIDSVTSFQFILILTIFVYVVGLATFSVALWLIQNEAARLAVYGVGVACMAFTLMIVARFHALEIGAIGGILAIIVIYFGVLHVQRKQRLRSNTGEASDS